MDTTSDRSAPICWMRRQYLVGWRKKVERPCAGAFPRRGMRSESSRRVHVGHLGNSDDHVALHRRIAQLDAQQVDFTLTVRPAVAPVGCSPTSLWSAGLRSVAHPRSAGHGAPIPPTPVRLRGNAAEHALAAPIQTC
ncbi:hypothetical protein CDAR_515441 [Caerostris darwini]|uniref:Uncharacterized protein n=1 Tax=Caerostris darwini TaxID=1538125 RepID=A0AAV4P5E9_9ARAC|nr:hypothetical protein CDAR_515441 [Caerostris darwini]